MDFSSTWFLSSSAHSRNLESDVKQKYHSGQRARIFWPEFLFWELSDSNLKTVVCFIKRSGCRLAIFWFRSAHQGKSSDSCACWILQLIILCFTYEEAEPSAFQRFFHEHPEINVAEFAKGIGWQQKMSPWFYNEKEDVLATPSDHQ